MAECDHGLTVDTCADCQRLPAHEAPADLADCRSCGAPVIWTVTERGKRMPVDAEPTPDGNIRLEQSTGGAPLTAVYLPSGTGSLLAAGERYTSHFATCEQAGEWRRS